MIIQKVHEGTCPESVTPPVNPKVHHIPNRLPYLWVIPVQIWLLCDVEMKVVFIRRFVVFPCRTWSHCIEREGERRTTAESTLENWLPVIRRLAVSLCIIFGCAPDVPVTLGVVNLSSRAGLFEPLVLNELHIQHCVVSCGKWKGQPRLTCDSRRGPS